MKRIRNTQIANKIIKSNRFKDYTRYSLQACFARALELEGDFQVGEVVTPNYVQAKCWLQKGKKPLTWQWEIQIMMQTLWEIKEHHLRGCIIQMFVGGVVKWDTSQEIALHRSLSRPKLWEDCIIH